MPTIIERLIGTGASASGGYETVAAWIAAIPADLVAADQVWRGLVMNQELVASTSTGFGTISGKNCNADCYIELTAAPNASFADHPSKGPLRYDATKGAALRFTGTSGVGLNVTVPHFRMTRLQMLGTNTNVSSAPSLVIVSGTGNGCLIDGCIFEAASSVNTGIVRLAASLATPANVIRSSAVIQTSTATAAFIADLQNSAEARNCTLVSLNATLTAGIRTGVTAARLFNTYVGGVVAPENGTIAAIKSGCFSDAAATNYTQAALSTANFVNVTAGTHDLRLFAGDPANGIPRSALIDAGVADASVTAGIYGTSRPQGAALDVGAWEYSAPLSAPVFTDDPDTISVSVGASAAFSVSVAGNPVPTLQWEVSADGGTTWGAISGATAATLTVNGATLADSGKRFRCVATNTQGTATSAAAALTVTVVAPSITTQPGSQAQAFGGTATFTVVASGSAPLSYQWEVSADSGSTWAVIGGATAASYTTPALVMADSGKRYRCVVTNAGGSATSNGLATLTVNAVVPTITQQPAAQSAITGATATFSVAATNAASYQWERLPSGGSWAAIAGATASSYTTPATTVSGGAANNGDQYRVVLTSSSGGVQTSAAATLTVTASAVAPTITSTLNSPTHTAGQTATFTITATGTAPLSYQWQTSMDGAAWTNVGTNSPSYTTPALTVADYGRLHRVHVSNSAGAVTSNVASLTVNAASTNTITTPPLRNNAGQLLSLIDGWTVNVYNPTTGVLVKQIAGLSTNAQGVLAVSDPLLVPGTYAYEPVHATYGRRLPVGVSA